MSEASILISFIRGVADTMEDFPPRFHQTINNNVAQSFNDAFENHIPNALQLMILTTITNALASALPPLLAPINNTLTRMETKVERIDTKMERIDTKMERIDTKMERMETKMERMETKLTRVGVMQAKVSVPIHIYCTFMSNFKH